MTSLPHVYKTFDIAGKSYRTLDMRPSSAKRVYFDEKQQVFMLVNLEGLTIRQEEKAPRGILCAMEPGVDETGRPIPQIDSFLKTEEGKIYQVVVGAELKRPEALKRVEEMCDWDLC